MWQHYVISVDAAAGRAVVYVDGAPVRSQAVVASALANVTRTGLLLGKSWLGAALFTGALFDFQCVARAPQPRPEPTPEAEQPGPPFPLPQHPPCA